MHKFVEPSESRAHDIRQLFDRYVIPSYGRFDLLLERGQGSYVWDSAGRGYLDFGAGIAVNALGHAHPEIAATLNQQARKLIHVSNLYYNEHQGRLAQRLVELIGPGRCFFCNSGAEANEGLFKLARKFGHPDGRYEVITADGSFHGRTLAGISATGQEKVKKGFEPMVAGFKHVPFNDLDAVRRAITPQTAAVLIEPIQGESGITPATIEYLRGLRQLCDERNLLLMFDEVQAGHFRTGRFQSWQTILSGIRLELTDHRQDADATRGEDHRQDADATRGEDHRQDADATGGEDHRQDADAARGEDHRQDADATRGEDHRQDADATGGEDHRQDAGATRGEDHRQDADATGGIGFQPMNPRERIALRYGANLPHWTQTGATYAVVFRLADSLPTDVVDRWKDERASILLNAKLQQRELSEVEQRRLRELFSQKVEQYLDAGYGNCWLRDDRIAEAVQDALFSFAGQRYDLFAWCIMPNHVHVIIQPQPGFPLPRILHSWKSFTANKANRILNRTGEFWQAESYDHLIRDQADFKNQIEYVETNPTKARLGKWPWVSRGIGFQPMDHRQDADGTRGEDHRQDADGTRGEDHRQDADAARGEDHRQDADAARGEDHRQDADATRGEDHRQDADATFLPDAVSMAKALGGGFPMGAFWVRDQYAELLSPGTHASTFGGTPLACAIALKVLEMIGRDRLAENAEGIGQYLLAELQQLQQKFPNVVRAVRGVGLMIGIEFVPHAPGFGTSDKPPAVQVVDRLHQNGLLTVPALPAVVRLLPPLNVSRAEAAEAIGIITAVVEKLSGTG
jgi:acetylornithine/succinyldiaminopimelate/putrescine aminotransferase/REP element-mobilizing transposase RayT